MASVLASVLIAGLGVLTVRECRRATRKGSNQWKLAVAMNLVVVVTLLLVSEVGLRLLAVPNELGEKLGGRSLYPKQWERARASYEDVLRKAETQPTYLVFDELLGFTVGPNRRSEEGLYFSSVRGNPKRPGW